jgi:hypothetical protein
MVPERAVPLARIVDDPELSNQILDVTRQRITNLIDLSRSPIQVEAPAEEGSDESVEEPAEKAAAAEAAD